MNSLRRLVPVDCPVMEMHLRRLYVKSGQNALELDGEGISLLSPHVWQLIAQVFAGSTDPADQAKIDALRKTLTASAADLEQSVETNTPKT